MGSELSNNMPLNNNNINNTSTTLTHFYRFTDETYPISTLIWLDLRANSNNPNRCVPERCF